MAQGRFTLTYMSHDHLHGSHAGLPMVERVNFAEHLSSYHQLCHKCSWFKSTTMPVCCYTFCISQTIGSNLAPKKVTMSVTIE